MINKKVTSDGRERCTLCDEPANREYAKRPWCTKHARFKQMRNQARKSHKIVPSVAQLEKLLAELNNFECPKCERIMNWLARDGRARTISLQHYRDGSIGFLCSSCNSRHQACPGDSFLEIPIDFKLCRLCKIVKPRSEFSDAKNKNGAPRKQGQCKDCSAKLYREWMEKNREHCRMKSRNYYALRKSQGRPLLSGQKMKQIRDQEKLKQLAKESA